MKIESKLITVHLTDDLLATIELVADGQEMPNKGDLVKVNAIINLPANSSEGSSKHDLADELKFGSRVKIFGQALDYSWGYFDSDSESLNPNICQRFTSRMVTSSTWKDAFKQAEEQAVQALQPLLDALAVRKQALLDAEKD